MSPPNPNPPQIPETFGRARIVVLLASLLAALAAGTNYVTYGPQLGAKLGISHTQLNFIGLGGNVGSYVSAPIWGKIVDSRGPKSLLLSGFVLLLAGYSGIRLIYDAGLPTNNTTLSTAMLALLIACSFMTGFGGNGGMAAAINTTAKTFPDKVRGSTTGLVISGFGLSAFLFSAIAHLAFPGDTSSFLLLLSIGTSFPMLIGVAFVRPIPLHASEAHHEPFDIDHAEADAASLAPGKLLLDAGPNVYGVKLWSSIDFWIPFITLSLLSGTGLMYINNVGSMAQALYVYRDLDNYNEVDASQWQATQVSTISFLSFSGRVVIGLLSDFVKSRFDLPRSTLLVLVAFILLLSQVAAAYIENVGILWRASALLGLGYGSMFSLYATLCIEWFGLPHFSENWGYFSLSPLFGGNIFSILFGRNLDAHEQDPTEKTFSAPLSRIPPRQCLQGLPCYVDSLYLTIGACAVAMVLSVWAAWRDRKKTMEGDRDGVYRRLPEVIWEEEDGED
ncbi:MFS general substrate transporter [Gymnopus androsaceus JB14]|uniref:MFS general substrate transporter n=1 Tax=Gymnopus androsaceus JB14 TaxID=1447944 RepID=A0A6A4IEX8_9AGAR|nr:MFS general substrate transporter [Gymnopus androsaceus JB14]